MRQRLLGKTQRFVGEVGLGCWQIGAEWGEVPEARAMAVLEQALQRGVTFFDTADVYGKGRSERLVGQCLRGARARPFVATKVGRFPDPGFPGNFAFEAMRRHVLGSRERLGVERIDLVQLHCLPPQELERGAVFDHLRRLQQEGVVAHWGASVESVAEADRCLREPDCSSLQVICSVLRQTPMSSGLLARASKQKVAILARLPLASGLLSGRMTAATVFAADDHRTFNRDGLAFHVGETFAGLEFEDGLRLVAKLGTLLPPGLPMAQAALRWLLDHDEVTVVIPGASRPEQIAENCAASALPPLGPVLHAALREFFQKEVKPLVRGND
jgi:aryl-alcohol dehydrogenase-like predicted oxidoreductase